MARGHPISPTNLPSSRTPTKSTISSPVPSSTSTPSTPRGKPSGSSPLAYRENGSDRLNKPCLSQGGQVSPTGSKGTLRSTASGKSSLQQRVSFVDDEKTDEAEDNEEETVEETSKNAPVYLNRSKGLKVQSLRYVTHTTRRDRAWEKKLRKLFSSRRVRTPAAATSAEQSREANKHPEMNAERDEASKSCQDQDSSSSDTRKNSQAVSPKTPEYPQGQ